MQAVILAGGLGTRLRPTTETIPKAMVPVLGRPFIDHELELLKAGGVDDFVICVGHLGELIEEHLGDGRHLGVKVRYSHDGPKLLGPAGALKRAENLLEDSFFVTYGDAYLRAPLREMMRALFGSGRLGLMAVYRNSGKHGPSDVEVSGGMVVGYDKESGDRGFKWINYGLSALRREALKFIPRGRPCWEEEFYGALIAREELMAFRVSKRFYEIGTQSSLADFRRYLGRRRGLR